MYISVYLKNDAHYAANIHKNIKILTQSIVLCLFQNLQYIINTKILFSIKDITKIMPILHLNSDLMNASTLTIGPIGRSCRVREINSYCSSR